MVPTIRRHSFMPFLFCHAFGRARPLIPFLNDWPTDANPSSILGPLLSAVRGLQTTTVAAGTPM
ncbi:hypothetical protein KL86DES1_10139 [uncultured Desulfovibrio sp.]|uniref:Uncharacterized protein n=1 Tax=uncultured Desulfovibrio sp. TaxID=167968 RepID=A0A212KXK2_9BACT|nr:hypothetical protein KL86DES1_10139 [uncultured Desulfovibrio sp.]VZH35352.1 conserved protein of unknown function [Desulfovibrio sp. 86]